MRPAFTAAGLELVEIDWHAPMAEFVGATHALIGTPWDYQDHPSEFLARLEALEAAGVSVHNPPEVVRWNLDKRYLDDLAGRGAPTLPTLWMDDVDRRDIIAALEQFQTDSVVVKRQVGAGAMGQHRFTDDNLPADDWRMGHAAMIQPFVPSIESEGEISLIFIDGVFSHGVRKRPAQGDYRIQSLFGGTEEKLNPSHTELAQAQAVMAALPFPAPLYARVDVVGLPAGGLAVMEVELIEPYLYPEQGPELGEKLALALTRRSRASARQ